MKLIIIPILLAVLTGCASNKGITQLQQINVSDNSKVIILKDEPTRASVLPVLEKWFSDNGYSSQVVSSLEDVKPNDYILSYRAWWGWDLATYMKNVHMNVKAKGETLGQLNFDALQYGGFGKFGDAEQRLAILLDALFGKITIEQANKSLGGG
ncbi:MAG: hypothetical protein HRU23_04835 [Gammaproteobacteria bacterium]|nr:hypothetical protein [Gammaproteobacteria bacterium]